MRETVSPCIDGEVSTETVSQLRIFSMQKFRQKGRDFAPREIFCIILDTNALMAIGELKIDLFTEIESVCHVKYKLCVLQGSIDELQKIMKQQRGKFKRSAALALSLLKAKKIEVLHSEENVDDVLVQMSQHGVIVLTQDRELKRRLKKPYLTIRQKKKVVMIEGDD